METPDNPPENVLPSSISEAAVIEALAASGYPLQVSVARQLRDIKEYKSVNYEPITIIEEWTFIDRDTEKPRGLDILFELKLPFTYMDKTYAALTLLIECKASKHPFVFFETASPYELREFRSYPKIVGLRNERITLNIASGFIPYMLVVPQQLLAIKDIPTTLAPAAHASSYTKVIPEGRKARTSGEDAYNSTVLPLLKAMAHYATVKLPAVEHTHFHAIATFAIAVIDAPLLVSRTNGDLVRVPWVRLSKHELAEGDRPGHRDDLSVIDFVHAAFFHRFLCEFILPFASHFTERVKRQRNVLAAGKGQLPHVSDADSYYLDNASI
jgi:hypothetical protein